QSDSAGRAHRPSAKLGACVPAGRAIRHEPEGRPVRGFEMWILRAAAVLLVLAIHEYAHAAVAVRLGDPRPKYDGRLTLNPFVHLDPIGTLMLLVFGFGWAKPVMVDPTRFKNPRRD